MIIILDALSIVLKTILDSKCAKIDQRIKYPFAENNCNLCGIKIVNRPYLQTPDTKRTCFCWF